MTRPGKISERFETTMGNFFAIGPNNFPVIIISTAHLLNQIKKKPSYLVVAVVDVGVVAQRRLGDAFLD